MLKMDKFHKEARVKSYDLEYEKTEYIYELTCYKQMTNYVFYLISLCSKLKKQSKKWEKIGWEQE